MKIRWTRKIYPEIVGMKETGMNWNKWLEKRQFISTSVSTERKGSGYILKELETSEESQKICIKNTFKSEDEKTLRVVLKGNKVENKGIEILCIVRMYRKVNFEKVKSLLVLIQLEEHQPAKEFTILPDLENWEVLGPKLRRTNVLQCFICQVFRHNKARCRKNSKFVKFVQSHLIEKWGHPNNTEAKCADYGGLHSAN